MEGVRMYWIRASAPGLMVEGMSSRDSAGVRAAPGHRCAWWTLRASRVGHQGCSLPCRQAGPVPRPDLEEDRRLPKKQRHTGEAYLRSAESGAPGYAAGKYADSHATVRENVIAIGTAGPASTHVAHRPGSCPVRRQPRGG